MSGTSAPAGIAATLADSIDLCADEIAATVWTRGACIPRDATYWATRALDRAAMLVMDAHAHRLFGSAPEIVDRIERCRSEIKPPTRPTNTRLREAVLVYRELWWLLINPSRDPAVRLTFASEAELFHKLAAIVRGEAGALQQNGMEPTSGTRKPGNVTKRAIKLIRCSKSVDEICAATNKSAEAVRRIKADYERGDFDLSWLKT